MLETIAQADALDRYEAVSRIKLQAAARERDLLVAGANSVASVTWLKGSSRPFVPTEERQAVLAKLAAVCRVVETVFAPIHSTTSITDWIRPSRSYRG